MNVLFLLKNTGMHERLGIMILSAVLKKNNHNAKLIITENFSIDDLIAKVEEYNPGIIAYSIMTGEHSYSIELNRMLKDHYEFYSVFGGPHPTFTPEMIEKDGVDSICIGEGDISFLKVVNALEVGEGFYGTPNFWFKKKDGTITKNPIGELIDDLDTIPFPDREIMYEAEPTLAKSEKKIFMAMRGCPYKCTYCFNHTYNKMTKGKGMVTRFRTVENILAEIKHVRERYQLESVWIDDDTFLVKPRGWLEEFAERFKKEIGLPLTCNIRGELMNDKNAKLLKEIGVNFVWMGIECGDEEIANKLLKRSIKNNTLLEAARILRENKINFFTQNLVGLPVDNPLETDLKTLDFNIALKPTFGWSSILYPYPGTEISVVAAKRGMLNMNAEKAQVSNKSSSILDFGDEKLKRKIVNLHKLFGIIVQFSFLRPLTGFLISLPLTTIYTWVFFAFYGYKYIIRRTKLRNLAIILWQFIPFYFKYVLNLERKKSIKNKKSLSYPQK